MKKQSGSRLRLTVLLSPLILCITQLLSAQSFNVSLRGGTRGYIGFDMGIGQKHRYLIGWSHNGHENTKTVVSERLPNYGQQFFGSGTYQDLLILGYSKVIRKITPAIYLGIGETKTFDTFVDNRFNSGGYTLVRDREVLLSLGVSIGYIIEDVFEPILGISTAEGVLIGVRFNFVIR